MWKMLLLVGGLLFNVAMAEEPNLKDFDDYQETVTKAVIQQRLRSYLVKSQDLESHYSLTDTHFKLYASDADKKADNAEYIFKFGTKNLPTALQPKVRAPEKKLPLKDVRIALDPGHVGGELARTEARYIDMKDIENVKFDEGTLTVLTSNLLKEMLEHDGAIVMVTKTKPGEAVFKTSYAEWKKSRAFEEAVDGVVAKITDAAKQKEAKEWWLTKASDVDVFRVLYNNLDLIARAEKINAFKPDLTVMIHYNAGSGNDKEGKNLGTKDNFNMAFVPGAFMKNELSRKSDRYHFMRLLVTSDLDESVRISLRTVIQLERNLNVPSVKPKQAPYLESSCLNADEGVYCRNMALTRLVKGPLCYGEALCQDNFDECKRLNERSLEVGTYKTSPRVKVAAVSYYEAIRAFFR